MAANLIPTDSPSILKLASVASDGKAKPRDLLLRAGALMLGVFLFALAYYNILGVIEGARKEVGGWFLVIGSLTAYYWGYKAVLSTSNVSKLRGAIVGFGAAFCLAALFIPPFFSTDVYCYGNIGWQQVKYGSNPYVYSLSEVPNWKDDPLFFASWENAPSAYGFLFSELTFAIGWLAGGNREATALLFKLLNVAIFAGTGWLVWRGCKYFQRSEPERTLYLYLWNPLLLLHIVSDGHNDLMMGLCSAAAVLWAIAGGWFGSSLLLLGGALVKFGSVILLPLLLLYLMKRYGKTKTAVGLTVGLILCAASAWPYLAQDWRHLALGRMVATLSEWRDYTLAAFLFYPYDLASHVFPSLQVFRPHVMTAIKAALWIGFFVFYFRLLAIRLRGPYDATKLLYDSVLVQFVLICFVSTKFYPWYLGMFLPLAYWLPTGDKLRHAVLAVACAQVLQFTFLREAFFINTVILLLVPVAYVWLAKPEKDVGVDRVVEEARPMLRKAA